ncbi:hypothetical protein [Actinocatenispora rupis]|uniref:hypothetical protein n=1 Tax=Actinocatenispora rupis TaxID=519421 RepID=UPI001941B544|nr:hypothetical protein [Actinocatenispora rupis]
MSIWLGGSVVLACALMAVVLYRSDLETLSWLAGVGSFLVAVPSLVLAIGLARTPTTTAAPPADGRPAGSADIALPERFELSTPAIRASERASAALRAAAAGVGILAGLMVLTSFLGRLRGALADMEQNPGGAAFFLGLFLVALPVSAAHGICRPADLIVDIDHLRVTDERRLRLKDKSFTLKWKSMETIRLVAAPRGSAELLVVTYRNTSKGARRAAELSLPESHGGYVVASLELGRAVPERLTQAARLREALALVGGVKFRN